MCKICFQLFALYQWVFCFELSNQTVQAMTSPVLLFDVSEDLHMLSSDLFAIPQ